MRGEWNKLWEILEDCWSMDPLDRPTASKLEARLHMIFQPRFMAVTSVKHHNLLPDPNDGTALAMSDERGNLEEKVFLTCSFI
jgi:hypothetical protein